ncbi:MAG: 16S rRNA (cytosine(1402)-N(4))-methyltransferase RsmH [Gemmatimonadota bacterium]
MEGSAGAYHVPVMVEEAVGYLRPERGGTYFDGTVGGGGHAEAILERSETARVIGVDRDPEALEAAGRRLARYGERVRLERGDFADAAAGGEGAFAGALLDLGLSSRHIDVRERGFTFREGSPLDMRMAGRAAVETPTAADLLNRLPERELADLLRRYGEERRAGRVARAVVERRRERPLERSEDLVGVLERAYGRPPRVKEKARIFQALRIAVNDELRSLERALPALRERLEGEGTLVVLAYHSLEDRIVKRAFREWSRGCVCPPELPVCRCRGEPLGAVLTKRPERPSTAEVERNPRARSARLRAWRKAA